MHDVARDAISWQSGDNPHGPVLVTAFRGWNDAGDAATAALNFIAASSERRLIAEIDPEEFFDFGDARPSITLRESRTRKIEWPRNAFYAVDVDGVDAGLLLLDGTEPSLRWRTFCQSVLHVAAKCKVKQVVTLGALLADVPHTRPTTVAGIASDPHLVDQLGLRRSNYEGPTGIVGVLQSAAADAGLDSCSLWAAVPHYVAATPNPMAALALVRSFEAATGAVVDATEMEEASDRYQDQISTAVAADEEISGYVRTLEEAADDDPNFGGSIPSGEVIAQEIQRFLRHQEDNADN